MTTLITKLDAEIRKKILESINQEKLPQTSRPLVLKRVENRKNTLALHDAETGEVLAGQMSCDVVNNMDEPLHVIVKISLCGQNKIVGDDNEQTMP